MFQQILAVIIAIALSDIYIIIFKKILPIYAKRMNAARQRQNLTMNTEYKNIEYPKSFYTKYNAIIIVSVIMGIITSFVMYDSTDFISCFCSMASWGIGYISICATIAIIFGKIKKIYGQIKYDDPYYFLVEEDNDNE